MADLEAAIANLQPAEAGAATASEVLEAMAQHRALALALEALQPEAEAAMLVPVVPQDRLALVVTGFA